MDTRSLSSFSVFVRHVFLQHHTAEFTEGTDLRSQIYIFLYDIPVHNSIIYGNALNLQIVEP